jgi:uncharacterized Rmd1/YagE family protein
LLFLSAASDDTPGGDLFFFDYGVVACWGLDSAQVRQNIFSMRQNIA